MCYIVGSDLEKLNIQTRLNLSKLLDPVQRGHDWSALADKLGLKKYVDGYLGEQSPTGLLLTCFEVRLCEGKISSTIYIKH